VNGYKPLKNVGDIFKRVVYFLRGQEAAKLNVQEGAVGMGFVYMEFPFLIKAVNGVCVLGKNIV